MHARSPITLGRPAMLTSLLVLLVGSVCPLNAQDRDRTLVIEDDFDREQLKSDDIQWAVNDARAQRTAKIDKARFQSQARIDHGALKIVRTTGSDHAATCKTEGKFDDAFCELRFRMPAGAKFGFNMNDPGLKQTVHAGHVCRVEIGQKHVLIQDQKDGNMDLEFRKWRDLGASDKEVAARLKGTMKRFKAVIKPDQWHRLQIRLEGDTIEVSVDGETIGSFGSSGIDHATKRNIAFSVPKSVEIDDLKVWALK